jgi:hypothetical protein
VKSVSHTPEDKKNLRKLLTTESEERQRAESTAEYVTLIEGKSPNLNVFLKQKIFANTTSISDSRVGLHSLIIGLGASMKVRDPHGTMLFEIFKNRSFDYVDTYFIITPLPSDLNSVDIFDVCHSTSDGKSVELTLRPNEASERFGLETVKDKVEGTLANLVESYR